MLFWRRDPDRYDELLAYLAEWYIPKVAVDVVHDCALASFKSVKDLTEYEDGKAARLLTIVAFLSAGIAALFTRFSTSYAWPGDSVSIKPEWLFPAATYICFFLFLALATSGVLLVFWAIRPTFNAPKAWRGQPGAPRSMLFYQLILGTTPLRWAQEFDNLGGSDMLKRKYAKNYIFEAWLIAEKVAKKLRLLSIGVTIITLAIVILLPFLLFCFLTISRFPPALASTNAVTSSRATRKTHGDQPPAENHDSSPYVHRLRQSTGQPHRKSVDSVAGRNSGQSTSPVMRSKPSAPAKFKSAHRRVSGAAPTSTPC